jgi:hypothetical protein
MARVLSCTGGIIPKGSFRYRHKTQCEMRVLTCVSGIIEGGAEPITSKGRGLHAHVRVAGGRRRKSNRCKDGGRLFAGLAGSRTRKVLRVKSKLMVWLAVSGYQGAQEGSALLRCVCDGS